MKILNFTVEEILPSLLDKSKCQTIRPAWKGNIKKEARFEVGEKVKLLWNQRSRYNWFCLECRTRFTDLKKDFLADAIRCLDCNKPAFNKHLGNVEITEVFKIEMWIGNDAPFISGYSLSESKKLAELDGFQSYKDFVNFFLRYDLSEPKQFWVYRWRWL